MIPRIFEGQTVAICGGGPSLTNFQFDRLTGCNVIAINRALEFLPAAQVLWWSDAPWFRNNREKILAHAAPWKATGHLGYEDGEIAPPLHQYRFTGRTGFEESPRGLRHGNNSAFSAMNLAAHLGARRIVLFGVDMRHGPAGETHFHGGHGVVCLESTLKTGMLPQFETLRDPLATRGIDVLNASPESALRVWSRCTISDGVAACREVSNEELASRPDATA